MATGYLRFPTLARGCAWSYTWRRRSVDTRVYTWVVEIEAWPILGGVVDNTQAPALPAHRVILRGMAFMGGVEIKN